MWDGVAFPIRITTFESIKLIAGRPIEYFFCNTAKNGGGETTLSLTHFSSPALQPHNPPSPIRYNSQSPPTPKLPAYTLSRGGFMRDELKKQSADSKNVGFRYRTVILTDRRSLY